MDEDSSSALHPEVDDEQVKASERVAKDEHLHCSEKLQSTPQNRTSTGEETKSSFGPNSQTMPELRLPHSTSENITKIQSSVRLHDELLVTSDNTTDALSSAMSPTPREPDAAAGSLEEMLDGTQMESELSSTSDSDTDPGTDDRQSRSRERGVRPSAANVLHPDEVAGRLFMRQTDTHRFSCSEAHATTHGSLRDDVPVSLARDGPDPCAKIKDQVLDGSVIPEQGHLTSPTRENSTERCELPCEPAVRKYSLFPDTWIMGRRSESTGYSVSSMRSMAGFLGRTGINLHFTELTRSLFAPHLLLHDSESRRNLQKVLDDDEERSSVSEHSTKLDGYPSPDAPLDLVESHIPQPGLAHVDHAEHVVNVQDAAESSATAKQERLTTRAIRKFGRLSLENGVAVTILLAFAILVLSIAWPRKPHLAAQSFEGSCISMDGTFKWTTSTPLLTGGYVDAAPYVGTSPIEQTSYHSSMLQVASMLAEYHALCVVSSRNDISSSLRAELQRINQETQAIWRQIHAELHGYGADPSSVYNARFHETRDKLLHSVRLLFIDSDRVIHTSDSQQILNVTSVEPNGHKAVKEQVAARLNRLARAIMLEAVRLAETHR